MTMKVSDECTIERCLCSGVMSIQVSDVGAVER